MSRFKYADLVCDSPARDRSERGHSPRSRVPVDNNILAEIHGNRSLEIFEPPNESLRARSGPVGIMPAWSRNEAGHFFFQPVMPPAHIEKLPGFLCAFISFDDCGNL
jgi:hypothetical protein